MSGIRIEERGTLIPTGRPRLQRSKRGKTRITICRLLLSQYSEELSVRPDDDALQDLRVKKTLRTRR
jgi:hypothetical protein